ncbi:hypothetical protein P2P98_16160 [Microbacterium sp. Kw_RZR3]|uniref:hypothetical protein n=1 Tax=Microbacterium sp. Kw_RZR3 TaxID=3032903 RepID=UPI0023DC75BF|nr:hypothetical protein [Microbacterium sp. Kw_RZR3]MDF2047697.1 hypothetical protein [Microbacterium sp. Kw_RZR3]
MTQREPQTALPRCDVCTSVAVYRDFYGRRVIDIEPTEDRLAERLDDGRMSVLRADVPLRDMMPLARSDLKFTIVLFARCEVCGTTWSYGLCIRGQPMYKPVEAGAENAWSWDPVPERERWAQ